MTNRCARSGVGRHEGPDERGQGQSLVPARRSVRQIRRRAGRPRRVRAGRQRRDGNLDHLPRHQELAQRRHEREGGSDRQADRAIDVRPGAADLLGDAGLLQHDRRAPRRLCATAAAGAAGQPALADQCPGPRATPPHPPDRHPRQRRRFLPRCQVHRDRQARHQLRAGLLPRPAAADVDHAAACRWQRHRGRDRPRLPRRLFRRRAGRQGGVRLCHRSQGRGAGELRQGPRDRQDSVGAAAGRRGHRARRQGPGVRHRYPRRCGADDDRPRCRSSAGTCSSNSRPRRR